MKKLKDISKKQWGVVSTSIGSILIFIGLLAMVGIGSGDTYAATSCSCSSYGTDYTLSGTTCTKTVSESFTCCAGGNCGSGGYSTCPSSATNCVSKGTDSSGAVLKECTVTKTETKHADCIQVVACDAGYYYSSTTDRCHQCAAGTFSNAGATSCTKCQPGYYSDSLGSASCSQCQPGYYSSGTGATSCSKCPGGTYNSGLAASSCTKCPAGSFCPTGSITPRVCTSGYCPAGVASPYSCPSNATCSSGNFTCNPGYKPSGDTCVPEGSKSCYTATFSVDGSVVNTITGKLDADGDGCEVTAPSYTCSRGSFKGWFTTPTVCKQNVSGTGAGNILTLASNRTYYGCCYKSSGDNPVNPGGDDPVNPGGDDPVNPGGDSGNSSGGLGNADGGNNSNVNNNPSTATKAPLIIALMGVMSLAFGVFTYWKNRKVTDL